MSVDDHDSISPRRILVFGGTFDPPHLAHAALPAQAAVQLGCDLILYVPAAINPLKTTEPHASQEHRLAMLLLAIADVPNARISTVELERPGPSYMIDTLRRLREQYAIAPAGPALKAPIVATTQAAASVARGIPGVPGGSSGIATGTTQSASEEPDPSPVFRLLVGCDQALDFHRWKDWQQILMLATPAVMVRPPWNEGSFREALRGKYAPSEAESWMNWTLRLPMMDISATEIRRMLRANDSAGLQAALSPAVLNYIRSNRLYE